jgi:uncharacterized protein
MGYFFLKLLPPRPTFSKDMTPREADVMRQHVAYLTGLAERGIAIAFGPVPDPAGGYGIGVIEAKDEAEIRGLQAATPRLKP